MLIVTEKTEINQPCHKPIAWSCFDSLYLLKNKPPVLVTGSAKMNIFRKGADSLAGRYFLHRLYPLSVRELVNNGLTEKEACELLLLTGGFPGPCHKGKGAYANRWRKTHIERIITEDLLLLESVVVFIVRPYSKKLQRTLSKEPKIYFHDTGRIP